MKRTRKEIEDYIQDKEKQANEEPLTSDEINCYLNDMQFLSPNEPLTPQGISRVLNQIDIATKMLEMKVGVGGKTITLWNPNIQYSKNDIVLYFKTENKQVSPEVGKRTFAFILVSMKDGNDSAPNYDLVDGIPTFVKTNWRLLNPMSYLLQDLIGLKKVIVDIFTDLLDEHVRESHGIMVSSQLENNLLKKDYSNLVTPMSRGKYSLSILDSNGINMNSNGIMEYSVQYSFDEKANALDDGLVIQDSKYFYQKSPIWDESDQNIFTQKYTEDDLFSVIVHQYKDDNGVLQSTKFNNLRFGTNIFHAKIEFPTPFLDDEYCVFFDTYDYGQFVFGFNKEDIQQKTEPTYDAIVSRPMLMNKTPSGFDVILPIHTYFNSIQKYKIGVPWNNLFTLQAIGRYR